MSLELEPLDGAKKPPETILTSLAVLVATGGNASEAERLLKTRLEDAPCADTIRYWRDRYPNRYKQAQDEYGPQLEQIAANNARQVLVLASQGTLEAIEKAREQIPKIHNNPAAAAQVAANLMRTADVAGRKLMELTNRPTVIVERRDAGEILQRLQRFGIGLAVEGSAEEDKPELEEGNE